jgi:hypothetical protein
MQTTATDVSSNNFEIANKKFVVIIKYVDAIIQQICIKHFFNNGDYLSRREQLYGFLNEFKVNNLDLYG